MKSNTPLKLGNIYSFSNSSIFFTKRIFSTKQLKSCMKLMLFSSQNSPFFFVNSKFYILKLFLGSVIYKTFCPEIYSIFLHTIL